MFTLLPGFLYRDVAISLAGTFAHWMLYGVLLIQICLYYSAFPNDHPHLKKLVLLAFVLETIQTVMFTRGVFVRFAAGFDNLLLVNEVGTVWISLALMTGLIALLTQVFYCYRVAIFTKSKYAVTVIVMLSISQFGAAIATAIQTRRAKSLVEIFETQISLITIGIWGVSSAGCDTTIAVIMVYYLKKRDAGFKQTRNIVKRLIRLTIETGLVTALFSIATMALAYIPGNTAYYGAAIFVVAKIYSNSMIASLNSRMKVVSNSQFDSPPCWNESVGLAESRQSKTTQDLEFHHSNESVSTTENIEV